MIPQPKNMKDLKMNDSPRIDLDAFERRILSGQAQSAPANGHAAELPEVSTMVEAVKRATIEEVPEAARMVAGQTTDAVDLIASDMERTADLLYQAAKGLRDETDRVCQDLKTLLSRARTLHELTRATRAAYADVPRKIDGMQ